MTIPSPIHFTPWRDPVVDHFELSPSGPYGRLGWLPIIGPSSYLIWSTLAAQLASAPTVDWDPTDLAQAHGLGAGLGPNASLSRTLTRLCQFDLLRADPAGYAVRTHSPLLRSGQVAKASLRVQALHAHTVSALQRRIA